MASARSSPAPEIAAESHWRVRRLFFFILALHCAGIYFFTRGFLLTRTELSAFSSCADISQSPCFPSNITAEDSSSFASDERCWVRPAVDRLVIVVFDALRFDFMAPSLFFGEKMPWMDKLDIIHKLASTENSSRIFKAIADPPTTSLQRLKALTTGGLPTFIDVGNSFGAPAIIEDNLIYQMAKNGKRVVMMGDDTWVQLFPEHFEKSYPYPSFDVKDLDTVDNGVLKHLVPLLYEDDWDVLIAHFLGVDHAGHIFGVDSIPMMQKLEHYNSIVENIFDVLKSLSSPGGQHENTMLLVMGDHGQTLNGDHGGGGAEEVETSLFSWSPRIPPSSVSSILDESLCKEGLGGKVCVSTMQQLDFSVTIAALLGIPFPFGSIGKVNPELYALSAGSWDNQKPGSVVCNSHSDFEAWMQNYAQVLCLNSWQVKRYVDLYTATSALGLPSEDLRHISDLYASAQGNWSNTLRAACLSDKSSSSEDAQSLSSVLRWQINSYSEFLGSFAKLARSAWTEFNLPLMGIGFGIMLVSIMVHLRALTRMHLLCSFGKGQHNCSFFRSTVAFLLIVIRAVSFLSNSFILSEGRVANFLLATAGVLNMQYFVAKGRFSKEGFILLLLNVLIWFGIDFGMAKQSVSSAFLKEHSVSYFGINTGHHFWVVVWDILPVIVLFILAYALCKIIYRARCLQHWKCFVVATIILSYIFISSHWASESSLVSHTMFKDFGRTMAPRLVYAVGAVSLVLSISYRIFAVTEHMNTSERMTSLAVAMVSSWSSTILILLGRQGPFAALIIIAGAWCIARSQKNSQRYSQMGTSVVMIDPLSIAQWSLLAVCMFFFCGHWCAFDGLRYSAAFIGFDHFKIIRQGILLAVDTFGISHIIPILSLPFLVQIPFDRKENEKISTTAFSNLTKVFLMYGLVTAITTTFTILCVAIQRRHLMVWGLFAPKYVFDSIGLLLTDVLICLASLYYYC